MNTSVERLDGDHVRLTVTVPAADVDREVSSVYSDLASKLSIPGFRRGKVPRPIIDSHAGRTNVMADVAERLITWAVPRAIVAEDLRIVGHPDAGEIEVAEPGHDYTFSVEVTLRPVLTLSSLDGLEATVPSLKVSDEDVDAQIELMRERFSALEVTDAPIADGNTALISFKGTMDGEAFEGGSVDKYFYELGKGRMPEPFEKALIGVKAGGTAVAEFVIPDTSTNPDYVGKTAHFDIEVHEVKRKVLPDLGIDFAATAGGFDTMEEYRENVREKLEAERAKGHDEAVHRAALDALVARLEGEVAEEIIEDRAGARLNDLVRQIEGQGVPFDHYMYAMGETPDSLLANLRKEAEETLREELALEALCREKNITVTDDDVDAEMVKMLGGDDSGLETMRERLIASGNYGPFRDGVAYQRAMECLLDLTTISEEGQQ